MQIRSMALIIGTAFAGAALAQGNGIGAIRIDPATAKAGQEVKITVDAQGEAPSFCGLAIDFGDGDTRDVKIAHDAEKFPVTVTKTYAKAGTYTVKAYGRKITTHFPCNGKAEATLTVAAAKGAAAAGAAPAAGAAAVTAAACPPGYALKGTVSRSGEYTCKAKPVAPTACVDGLEPFASGDTLGCRKAKARK